MLNIKNKTFSLKDVDAGHHKVTYKGIPAIKSPFDYVLYQMLIFAIKPGLIIEIGTNQGGSALYMADLLDIIGTGEVHTIDIASNKENFRLNTHSRIKIFRNGFRDYDTKLMKDKDPVIVIDDGSHHYQDCHDALNKFAPFVSKGSYFIVEDGIINDLGREKEFEGGPQKAIREFLPKHPEFEIDRNYCDFFGSNATFNVNGYLKRKS